MSIAIRSVQVGGPKQLSRLDPWTTAFFKNPVAGPVELSRLNLAGDRQADPSVHGGPDKAVCAYPGEHYLFWQRQLDEADCGPGWFGENVTLSGVTELDACIGDVFSVGTALVEISQPRAPCWKLGRRWNRVDMPKLVLSSGRTGWYFRVLAEGEIAAGHSLTLVQRPYPEWSVDRANRVKHFAAASDPDKLELAACPALSESWRTSLTKATERA